MNTDPTVNQNKFDDLRQGYIDELTHQFYKAKLLFRDRISLDDIYVEPGAIINQRCSSQNTETEIENLNSFLYSILAENQQVPSVNKVTRLNRILILGLPGQGKSTFCKRLICDVIESHKNKDVVFIPLKQLGKTEEDSLLTNAYIYLSDTASEKLYGGLRKLSKSEIDNTLFILDGLDELDYKKFLIDGNCSTFIDVLLKVESKCSILVTSRYLNLGLDNLVGNYLPLTIYLKEFDSPRQIKWIKKYKSHYPEAVLSEEVVLFVNRFDDFLNTIATLQNQVVRAETAIKTLRNKLGKFEDEIRNKVNTELAVLNLRFNELKEALELDKCEDEKFFLRYLEKLEKKYPCLSCNGIEDIFSVKNRHDAIEVELAELKKQIAEKAITIEKDFLSAEKYETLQQLKVKQFELDSLIKQIDTLNKDNIESKEAEINIRPIREMLTQPLLLYLIARLNIDPISDHNIKNKSTLYKQLVNELIDNLFDELLSRKSYCAFRRCRPPIPTQVGRLFRLMSAGYSG